LLDLQSFFNFMRAQRISPMSQWLAVGVGALLMTFAGLSPSWPSPAQLPPSRDVKLQSVPQVNVLPEKQKRYALIIGVNRYEDPQINPLLGAANDARAIVEALINYAGFPADQVILLASDQPPERQPTRGIILRKLSNLKTRVPQDGLLLVSFAGHGIQSQDQAFLLALDSQLSGDLALLRETAINVETLRRNIREMGVRQVIMILDACRNEPGGRSLADNVLTKTLVNGLNFDVRNREVEAFVTLYASEVGHRAYEFVEKKQGYFSWFLVQGLKGAAANERGEVTLASLVRYLQDQVPKQVLLDLGVGREQKPWAAWDGYKAEELVLAVTVAGAKPALGESLQLLEEGLWRSVENSRNIGDFQTYLEKYPNGKYVEKARKRSQELNLAPRPSKPAAPPSAQVSLKPFTFNTAKVNSKGEIAELRPIQRQFYMGDCVGVPLEMVFVPGGSFPMGLTQKEVALYRQEMGGVSNRPQADAEQAIHGVFRTMLPEHVVSVSSFYMSKYEITQAQWRAAARLPKVARGVTLNPSSSQGDKLPVDQVSWEEAMEFCARLSRQSGQRYRLPSEAEWEYACRAGSTTPYHFGESLTPTLANCRMTAGTSAPSISSNGGGALEVGKLGIANAFGLFDLHGNVQEWCLDVWHDNYQGAPPDGSAWSTGGNNHSRALRGGSWKTECQFCRSAERDHADANAKNPGVGFRVVMELAAKSNKPR
jgi:formylglycine-generating enzyme required for sulfatase activity